MVAKKSVSTKSGSTGSKPGTKKRAAASKGPEVGVQEQTEQLTATNRKLQAEIAARRESEERFRSLFQQAPDSVVLVDADTYLWGGDCG